MSEVGAPFHLMPHMVNEARQSMRRASFQSTSYKAVQLPKTDDEDIWHEFWVACGQPWRYKPKISLGLIRK